VRRLVSLTGEALCLMLVAAMPVKCTYLCQLQTCGLLALVTVSGFTVLIHYCALQVPGDAAPFPCLHGDTSQEAALDVYGHQGRSGYKLECSLVKKNQSPTLFDLYHRWSS